MGTELSKQPLRCSSTRSGYFHDRASRFVPALPARAPSQSCSMNKPASVEYPTTPADLDPDLRHFFEVLRNRRGTFVRVFLVILTIGIAATLLSKPIYQTRVQFLIPVVSPSLQ